ncbi:MAG: cytochrome c [candidate division Zixibacteria bacterium]|nr:cytochrome c [candidate division Zixibacteria bacterium]
MKTIIAILIVIVILAGAVFFYINSGWYNISANSKHNGLTLRLIETTKDRSIHHHAEDTVLSNLQDSSMLLSGFKYYDSLCLPCHGAIGISRERFALGMYPLPPELIEEVGEWSPAELFWITKNGIKLTGMPAFGELLGDQDIWSLVAFMQKLPEMSYYDYQRFRTEGRDHGFGQQ